MFLLLPRSVRQVQGRLLGEARRRPSYRFGGLLPLVLREDVLASAYEWVRLKGGSAGLDGRGLRRLGDDALLAWAREERRRVMAGEYRPGTLLRVPVPKPSGGTRILGVPNVEDRILQTAVRFVVEPVFEAGFLGCAWGYRQGRGVRQAVASTHRFLCDGYTTVIDGDVRKFFDEVPHGELIAAVAERISDRRVLDLIRGWLVAPSVRVRRVPWERWIWKRGRRVRKRGWSVERTTVPRPAGRGIPQGAAISPLLANVYVHRFLVPWMSGGMDRRYGTAIVNYADDFLVLTRGRAAEVLRLVRRAFQRLGLELNERKTRIVDVRTSPLEYLGYRFRVEPAASGTHRAGLRAPGEPIPPLRTSALCDDDLPTTVTARSSSADWFARRRGCSRRVACPPEIGVAPAYVCRTGEATRDSAGATDDTGSARTYASSTRVPEGADLVVIAEPSPGFLARRIELLRELIPAYVSATDPVRKAAIERDLRPLVPEPRSWRGRLVEAAHRGG